MYLLGTALSQVFSHKTPPSSPRDSQEMTFNPIELRHVCG